MNKKMMMGIGIVAAVALLLVGVVKGKQYYDNRYVGKEYFAMVPMDYDVTPEDLLDMDGNVAMVNGEAEQGKLYRLTAFNENGESKEVEFIAYADRNELPQPGTFLHLSASNELVLEWGVIEKNQVPENVLALIQGE
jgi:uncharacterized protein (TIGR01655 family)